MPTTATKGLAYHDISNAKYAMRTGASTPVPMLYSKSIARNPVTDSQDVYADGRQLLRIPSDQGDDGSYGTTAVDVEFEKAVGLAQAVQGGLASTNLMSYKRFDLYYEFKIYLDENQSVAAKVWVLNVEVGRPALNHQTDTNTATIGEYSYPLRIYGDKLLQADGTKTWRDENGLERVVRHIMALPGDDGYETFEDSVPKPTAAV